MRINCSKEFVHKQNYINSIEKFWSQAKRYMRKFNGIPKEYFVLHLRQCEWRFNHSDFKSQKRCSHKTDNTYNGVAYVGTVG